MKHAPDPSVHTDPEIAKRCPYCRQVPTSPSPVPSAREFQRRMVETLKKDGRIEPQDEAKLVEQTFDTRLRPGARAILDLLKGGRG